jgi:hypothetical protein
MSAIPTRLAGGYSRNRPAKLADSFYEVIMFPELQCDGHHALDDSSTLDIPGGAFLRLTWREKPVLFSIHGVVVCPSERWESPMRLSGPPNPAPGIVT